MSTQPGPSSQSLAAQETAVSKQNPYWRYLTMMIFVAAMFFVLSASTASSSSLTTPTITIISVVPEQSVNIQTNNYPPNQTFVVRMNYMGTLGLDGEVVGNLESGTGGFVPVRNPWTKG